MRPLRQGICSLHTPHTMHALESCHDLKRNDLRQAAPTIADTTYAMLKHSQT